MYGGAEGQFLVPFRIPDEALVDPKDPNSPGSLALVLHVGWEKSQYSKESEEGLPTTLPWLVQNPDASPEQVRLDANRPGARGYPGVMIEILDQNLNTLVNPGNINAGKPVSLADATGEKPAFAELSAQGVVELSRTRERVSSSR